jgi:hypothetical protein
MNSAGPLSGQDGAGETNLLNLHDEINLVLVGGIGEHNLLISVADDGFLKDCKLLVTKRKQEMAFIWQHQQCSSAKIQGGGAFRIMQRSKPTFTFVLVAALTPLPGTDRHAAAATQQDKGCSKRMGQANADAVRARVHKHVRGCTYEMRVCARV